MTFAETRSNCSENLSDKSNNGLCKTIYTSGVNIRLKFTFFVHSRAKSLKVISAARIILSLWSKFRGTIKASSHARGMSETSIIWKHIFNLILHNLAGILQSFDSDRMS